MLLLYDDGSGGGWPDRLVTGTTAGWRIRMTGATFVVAVDDSDGNAVFNNGTVDGCCANAINNLPVRAKDKNKIDTWLMT